MMGYLCLCPPAVCRPSALTYSCRPRSSDADNLRILRSNSYRACSQENDKYDFDPQTTSSTSFTWTWDGFTRP